jgi:transcriptional regulator with PAS, ATPase and Fis domain
MQKDDNFSQNPPSLTAKQPFKVDEKTVIEAVLAAFRQNEYLTADELAAIRQTISGNGKGRAEWR